MFVREYMSMSCVIKGGLSRRLAETKNSEQNLFVVVVVALFSASYRVLKESTREFANNGVFDCFMLQERY